MVHGASTVGYMVHGASTVGYMVHGASTVGYMVHGASTVGYMVHGASTVGYMVHGASTVGYMVHRASTVGYMVHGVSCRVCVYNGVMYMPLLCVAMAKLARQSRHWPLVYADTLIHTLAQVSPTVFLVICQCDNVQELQPLPVAIRKDVMSDQDFDECKKVSPLTS